jgi:D-3-phosphoglycerate dehydrogenase
MTERLSLARDRINVLLLEGINQTAVDYFKASGYTNVTHLPKALDKADLIEAISSAHIVGIRSRTQLTEEIFAAANRVIVSVASPSGPTRLNLKLPVSAEFRSSTHHFRTPVRWRNW